MVVVTINFNISAITTIITIITITNTSDANTINIATNTFLKFSAFTMSLVITKMEQIFFDKMLF